MALQTINPATGELIQEFKEMGKDEINEALDTSVVAYKEWRNTSFETRSKLLFKVAADLRKNSLEYGRIITLEMGKPLAQAVAEVEKCAWGCEYYAEHAEEFLADDVIQTEAQKSYVHYQPLGVLLAVMPWNFPFHQVFRAAAPATMAGNVVVLKHASNVTMSALKMVEIFERAGYPKGVFSTLLVGGAHMDAIVADARIAAATVTGSEFAGSRVAAVAGEHIKPTVLELGGSDPFIILEDADLESAVPGAVTGRTLNAGQSCICAKRFIVVESVYDEFVDRFVPVMEALKMGDPQDAETQIGPLARADLRDELHKQVEASVEKGARLLTGGRIPDMAGSYYPPTVLVDVAPGMPAYDEEFFGPVAIVIKVKDEKDAIRVANDSRFGLGGAVWSQDIERAQQVAHQIESGAVFINDFVKSDPRLPFGGIKKSGYGRELSRHGIHEFVNAKTIVVK